MDKEDQTLAFAGMESTPAAGANMSPTFDKVQSL